MKIAVFVSGRGSNLQAIINSGELRNLIEIKAVISDKLDCPAFEIARSHSIPTYIIGSPRSEHLLKAGNERLISYNELSDLLIQFNVELIVLAGFLKLIPDFIIKRYKFRIINIHPALLPSFGGKGMYGINVHKAVFDSSAKVSGPTVHFVDETFDTGKIIAQRCVDISDVSSPEEIAERVLKLEHEILPFVIKKIAEGKVIIEGGRVVVV
ncbi:MAG TPA: phosphoribosylglycinamide formyltransferase [Ignavibacteriaceae bacterium]|nr:phosphoribosylglycinamide formyltransferase [Ignavibacteriaceae bacterium]